MISNATEVILARLLYIGVPLTSVFILTGNVSDPVNVTKLFIAGVIGFAVLTVILVLGLRPLWITSKIFAVSAIVLMVTMLNASIASNSAFVTNLYGILGRNTGLLTYFSFLSLALGAALLREKKNFDRLVIGLIVAGVINVVYCLWAWQIGDFITWNNPFGTILGTFGNPNFISAFLGIFISATTSYLLIPKRKIIIRLSALILILVAFLEILHTHSIQGVVVTGIGLAYNGFVLLRSKTSNSKWIFAYLTSSAIVGGMSVAGMLQIGPLTKFLYKTSVSLRGEYWQAGINMGQSNPLTGIGMDGYGNLYRQARDASALILPGPTVVTNAAHNVVIDFFAYGGYPLLIAYLLFLFLGARSIVTVLSRSRNFDPVFTALSVSWVCYQAQSIISINQIGLAIWGWVLTGALIGFDYSNRSEAKYENKKGITENKTRLAKQQSNFSPTLIAGLGAVVGALIAVPPYNADISWRNALSSQELTQVELALTPSYLTPSDSSRLANAVTLMEQSKLYDQSYKYAKYAVEFNPDYFDAWKILYYVSKSTPEDKKNALANLKRLDPLNPDVLVVPK
jgi:hypothetical protein